MTSQEQRMTVLREVAQLADGFYDQAEQFGTLAANALTRNKRSQVTGLEQMANSALKTSDIFDFIKVRIARQKEWQARGWGIELLEYLSQQLQDHQEAVCHKLNIERASGDGIEVYLLLIQAFVHQFSAQYEYQCYLLEEGKGDG